MAPPDRARWAADAERAARAVDKARLWERHMRLAEIGATAKGGVNRQAFSTEDVAARRLVRQWAEALGCTATTDRIGNLFLRRPGRDGARVPVMTGSHLDSQPTGGRFDGAYGVLAGLEALAALADAGVETDAPIEVVAWSNEEGGRFQPGAMGSAVFAGRLDLAHVVAATDAVGTRLGDALATTLATMPDLPQREARPPAAYLEAHIEQGPILEARGLQVGVVTDIQGIRQYRVEVSGTEAHAGTTPMADRRDAVLAATRVIGALEALTEDADDRVRFTVGRFETQPGSPNTVPSLVLFTIDLRHPDAGTIEHLHNRIVEICNGETRNCGVAVTELIRIAPTRFDRRVVDAVRSAAAALGLSSLDMVSGAGHDAMFLAELCPAGMIFVPCEKGVSHNEAENAKPEDLAAGARVLTRALAMLANEPPG